MVDPRVLHQVTVEIATGFLVLAGVTVGLKLASEIWLRRFSGRYWTLDRWSRSVGAFAEPTAFVALTLGVLTSFVTSWTGLNVWPASLLWTDPTVRNKMLLVSLSTTLFVGAFILRARFKSRIWRAASTGTMYAFLVLAGNVFLVLQNSVGGHLQGTGSLLDDLLAMINLDETVLWTIPPQAALLCLIGFPLVVLFLGLRLRAASRAWAYRELVPMARELKGLLAEAQRADLGVDGPRRLIGRANLAVRDGHYARAIRLLEKARDSLLIAPPFTGSVEGIEFWANTELPRKPRARGPLGGPAGADPAAFDSTTGPASLPGAVELVEGSLSRFQEAPLLRLQSELRAARDALLDFKARGWDLTEPIRMLKAAHAHLERAEWDDAIRVLEEFRREMTRMSEAEAEILPGRDDPGSSTSSADDS